MTEENSLGAERAFVFCGATGQNERGVNEFIPHLVCLCFRLPPSTYPGKTLPLMREHVFGLLGSLHSAAAREMTCVHRYTAEAMGMTGKCLIVDFMPLGDIRTSGFSLAHVCVCVCVTEINTRSPTDRQTQYRHDLNC